LLGAMQEEHVSIFGIGPIIAVPGIISLCIAVVCGYFFDYFSYWFIGRFTASIAGAVIIIIGLIFFIDSILLVSKKDNKLNKSGVYKIVRHPMYSSFIVFFIPGISLIFNNWLILLAAVIAFIIFKKYIYKEEKYLEEKFGSDYQEYKRSTKQIVPFVL
jgi:protein-S-isoprenylcysteine O-methyltransferase Ste14